MQGAGRRAARREVGLDVQAQAAHSLVIGSGGTLLLLVAADAEGLEQETSIEGGPAGLHTSQSAPACWLLQNADTKPIQLVPIGQLCLVKLFEFPCTARATRCKPGPHLGAIQHCRRPAAEQGVPLYALVRAARVRRRSQLAPLLQEGHVLGDAASPPAPPAPAAAAPGPASTPAAAQPEQPDARTHVLATPCPKSTSVDGDDASRVPVLYRQQMVVHLVRDGPASSSLGSTRFRLSGLRCRERGLGWGRRPICPASDALARPPAPSLAPGAAWGGSAGRVSAAACLPGLPGLTAVAALPAWTVEPGADVPSTVTASAHSAARAFRCGVGEPEACLGSGDQDGVRPAHDAVILGHPLHSHPNH